MKSLFMIMLLALISCTSATRSSTKTNEFVRMNEVWKEKPSKKEVVKHFGPRFKEIEEGISYNYNKTSFTNMAFFFDKNKRLADQFAIVDEADLSAFKKGVPCRWIEEKKTQLREAHVVKTVESGECPEQHVKYFFRQDLGFYEIRWF